MAVNLQSVIAQMIGGQGASPADLRNLLLAQLGPEAAADPVRATLNKILAQTASSGSEPSARQRAEPGEQELAAIHALLRAARDELNLLQARSDALASALGACADCWGADRQCRKCGGVGAPGWLPPDPRAFAVWVEPAIRRTTESFSNGDPK